MQVLSRFQTSVLKLNGELSPSHSRSLLDLTYITKIGLSAPLGIFFKFLSFISLFSRYKRGASMFWAPDLKVGGTPPSPRYREGHPTILHYAVFCIWH